ncbi:hypothetical protein L1987_38068 [Smallanthus sonchifolius]|uniref:Uncharacterized protein n=1 Tax=Smallanthus sonchifolius TaxID=185202 RepID=A0ACB9HJI7_9ASTR|nr:hypothetical protein L1987_38068 [Smallanthus sonchifolius]
MSSMLFPELGGFPTRRRLCRQREVHPKTIQKHVHAVGHGIWERPGFGFRRIIRKPHALATEVSFKEPKRSLRVESEGQNVIMI